MEINFLDLRVFKNCKNNLCAEPILLLLETLNKIKTGKLEILLNKNDQEKILRVLKLMDCKIKAKIDFKNYLKIIIEIGG